MKLRIKHRKLFYVPGMISLVLIPILFLYYFDAHKTFEKEYSMDIGLPDHGSMGQIIKDYPLLNQRNYKEFTFNGSLLSDKNTLDDFQHLLKQQNKIKDTVNGIKLYFGKQMNYEVFIRILDILTIEKTPTYMPYGNELLIVNGSVSDIEREKRRLKQKFGKPMNCATQANMREQRRYWDEQQELINNENFQKAFFNRHWYLFLAYFGIVLLNFFTLIKFNKNRNYNQKSYI